MTMLANFSQEDHAQIEAFDQSAYNNPKAVSLREELRPLIHEQKPHGH